MKSKACERFRTKYQLCQNQACLVSFLSEHHKFFNSNSIHLQLLFLLSTNPNSTRILSVASFPSTLVFLPTTVRGTLPLASFSSRSMPTRAERRRRVREEKRRVVMLTKKKMKPIFVCFLGKKWCAFRISHYYMESKEAGDDANCLACTFQPSFHPLDFWLKTLNKNLMRN